MTVDGSTGTYGVADCDCCSEILKGLLCWGRWKASQEAVPAPPEEGGNAPEGQLESLSIKDQPEQQPPVKKKSGKKKELKPEIVLENSIRSKKKSVTTILGKESFVSRMGMG